MSTLTLPTDVLRQIAAAPHRLLFFIGATNVLLAMAWWAYWLGAAYTGATTPTLPVAPGWLHAIRARGGWGRSFANYLRGMAFRLMT